MRTLVFSTIIFAYVIILNTHSVSACTCLLIVGDDKQQVKKAYNESSAVFAGEVVEIIREPDKSFRVKFKVEKIWNGRFGKEVVLKTLQEESLCGYPFKMEKKYLVYAFEDKSELSTYLCSRTAPLKSNKDIIFLNKIVKKKLNPVPK